MNNFDCLIRLSPIPISAISGTGTGELLDLVCSGLKKIEVLLLLIFSFLGYQLLLKGVVYKPVSNPYTNSLIPLPCMLHLPIFSDDAMYLMCFFF